MARILPDLSQRAKREALVKAALAPKVKAPKVAKTPKAKTAKAEDDGRLVVKGLKHVRFNPAKPFVYVRPQLSGRKGRGATVTGCGAITTSWPTNSKTT